MSNLLLFLALGTAMVFLMSRIIEKILTFLNQNYHCPFCKHEFALAERKITQGAITERQCEFCKEKYYLSYDRKHGIEIFCEERKMDETKFPKNV